MSEPRRTIKKVPQEQFGKLLLALNSQKQAVQERLTAGLAVTELATEWHVPTGTMKSLLTAVGIVHGRNGKRPTFPSLVKAMLIVLRRVCENTKVPCPELDQYL